MDKDDFFTLCNLALIYHIDNAGKNAQGMYTPQRLGEKRDLRKAGEHRATWDSAADGVRLKGGTFTIQLMACEGDER